MKVWEFCYPESTSGLAEVTGGKYGRVECPEEPGHRREGKELRKWHVLLPRRPVKDVVWTWLSDCLLTERALKLFRKAKFTGFRVRPITARYKRPGTEQPPKLWQLRVTGWGGMAPPESGLKFSKEKSCPHCNHLRYVGPGDPTKLVREDQWDGSDFFMVWPLPKHYFVTQRVVDLVRSEKITGVQIKRPDQLEIIDGATPGPLSRYMPDARAKKLGEPLGIY